MRTLRALYALAWMRGPRSLAAALATHEQPDLNAQQVPLTPVQHQAGMVMLAACSLDCTH